MTRVPMFSATSLALKAGLGHPMSPRMNARYGVTEFSQFKGAQMIADKYGLTREDMDQYSLASHRKATAATAAGAFEREILPIRSAERRVGKEGVSTCRSRWSP